MVDHVIVVAVVNLHTLYIYLFYFNLIYLTLRILKPFHLVLHHLFNLCIKTNKWKKVVSLPLNPDQAADGNQNLLSGVLNACRKG